MLKWICWTVNSSIISLQMIMKANSGALREMGNLEYLGEDPSSYARPGFYAKGNRKEANDWSDLIALTRHLSKDDPDAFSLGLESVVHQALWLKYFAMDALLANTETSFANGGAGDYAFFIGSKILAPF